MLGMGDKKRLAMIIVGKPQGKMESPSSDSEDFVEKSNSEKETIPSEGATAMDDAMDAFLMAAEAKDRVKAVKAFKNLVSLCGSEEEDDDSEEMM